jgi:hypothetical protein
VIVARHPAPPAGKPVTVGKREGEWVYELFLTNLDGFRVSRAILSWTSIMDEGHSRQCSPMKMLKWIPIAGVLTQSVGKNCGKLPESAVWNLRLTLGHAMQGGELRDTLVGTSQRSSSCARDCGKPT